MLRQKEIIFYLPCPNTWSWSHIFWWKIHDNANSRYYSGNTQSTHFTIFQQWSIKANHHVLLAYTLNHFRVSKRTFQLVIVIVTEFLIKINWEAFGRSMRRVLIELFGWKLSLKEATYLGRISKGFKYTFLSLTFMATAAKYNYCHARI